MRGGIGGSQAFGLLVVVLLVSQAIAVDAAAQQRSADRGPARSAQVAQQQPAGPGGKPAPAGLPATAPAAAEPKSAWDITLGLGVAVGPTYEGSQNYEVAPIPIVDIVYRDRFFASTRRGLGVTAIKRGNFSLGVSIGPSDARDEDDDDALKGLGDIDLAPRGTLFARYQRRPVNVDASVSRDFGGSDGTLVKLGIGSGVPLGEALMLTAGASATWADDDHMQAFFGVTQAQSTRSGYAAFDAQAGFKRLDLNLGVNYRMTPHWTIGANAGVGVLVGDAADSPISQSDTLGSLVMRVAYRF